MALKELFDSWKTECERVFRALGETIPTIFLGAGNISNQNSTPRIVFVPTTGTIQDSIGQAGFGEGVQAPASLFARKVSIEAHIWGKDFGECEAIMRHVVAALHRIAWGGDRALSEDWTRNASANAASGVLVVLGMTVEIPLIREAETFATITDFVPMTPAYVTS